MTTKTAAVRAHERAIRAHKRTYDAIGRVALKPTPENWDRLNTLADRADEATRKASDAIWLGTESALRKAQVANIRAEGHAIWLARVAVESFDHARHGRTELAIETIETMPKAIVEVIRWHAEVLRLLS